MAGARGEEGPETPKGKNSTQYRPRGRFRQVKSGSGKSSSWLFRTSVAATLRYKNGETAEEEETAVEMFKDLRSNEFVANMTFANGKNLGVRDLDKHLFQMLHFPARGGKVGW